MKKFNNASVLLVNASDYSRKVLKALLKLIGIKDVDLAFEVTDALNECHTKQYNVIIGEMTNGLNDGIALAFALRKNPKSINRLTSLQVVTYRQLLMFFMSGRRLRKF